MGRPDHCPEEVFEIMMNCWKRVPFDRPTFKEIYKQLKSIVMEKSPQVNFQHFQAEVSISKQYAFYVER